MTRIIISQDRTGHIIVLFPYDPLLLSKLKTSPAQQWCPTYKYESFPEIFGLQWFRKFFITEFNRPTISYRGDHAPVYKLFGDKELDRLLREVLENRGER